MKRVIYAMILFITISCAGLLYIPLPTYAVLEREYIDMMSGLEARARALEKGVSRYPECVLAESEKLQKLAELNSELSVNLHYFKLYAEDSTVTHFREAKKEYLELANKTLKEVESCIDRNLTGRRKAG